MLPIILNLCQLAMYVEHYNYILYIDSYIVKVEFIILLHTYCSIVMMAEHHSQRGREPTYVSFYVLMCIC